MLVGSPVSEASVVAAPDVSLVLALVASVAPEGSSLSDEEPEGLEPLDALVSAFDVPPLVEPDGSPVPDAPAVAVAVADALAPEPKLGPPPTSSLQPAASTQRINRPRMSAQTESQARGCSVTAAGACESRRAGCARRPACETSRPHRPARTR